MNKRIRALAGQAREFATTRHPVSNIVLSVNSDKFEEKFAELLLQECAEVVDNHFESKTPGYPGDKIKQHFGVEE